jgi:hypothetical protein
MFGSTQYLQVLKGVVAFVLIFVMDDLIGSKFSPKVGFHHFAVLKDSG